MEDADVLVVGGGIAGLAVAVRLRGRGLSSLVLVAAPAVGRRMGSERVDGFLIDRGASVLGRSYLRIRALVRRFGLSPEVRPARIDFARQEPDGSLVRPAQSWLTVLRARGLSRRSRLAMVRLGLEPIRNRRALAHGRGDLRGGPPDRAARDSAEDSDPGEDAILAEVIEPPLRGAFLGCLESSSRLVVLQALWNFVRPQWNLVRGTGSLAERMASTRSTSRWPATGSTVPRARGDRDRRGGRRPTRPQVGTQSSRAMPVS